MLVQLPFRPLALLPAAVLALGASAAAATACPAGAHPTLTVQGEGRAFAQPDIATVTLGVTVQAPTAAQAMADNATRQQAVIDALKSQGIAPRDIQTSGLNLSPVQDYSREGKPPVITGYQAQNMVTIKVRDLTRLGAALDGLVSAGANEMHGIAFAREDQQAAEDEARADAVDSARHRADVLARAAGLTLGRLVTLTDQGGGGGGPMPMMAMGREKDAAATPIEAGELTVTAQVSATYALVEETGANGATCGPDAMRHGGKGHHKHHGGKHDGAPDAPAGPAGGDADKALDAAPVPDLPDTAPAMPGDTATDGAATSSATGGATGGDATPAPAGN